MNRIREVLQKENITVINLIKETGLSKSYIYDVINGKSTPTVYVAKKIASKLNVKVDDLFQEDYKD